MALSGGTDRSFGLRFWGVRGSLPVPGPTTARFGGNTTCFEIRAGDTVIMVDCGTGAYRLGQDLARRGVRRLAMLMTHTHLDHVSGFPYFRPAYDEQVELTCYAAAMGETRSVERILRALTAEPLWPLGRIAVQRTSFSTFGCGETLDLGDGVTVSTQRLNHPGGGTGYRIGYGGRSIVIVADHEHGDPAIDAEIVAFAGGADVMVYDATYTAADYEPHKGWGHSTWEAGLELATAAGVAVPVMSHHGPERTDDDLDALVATTSTINPAVIAAREGLILWLGEGGKLVLEDGV